MPQLPAKHITTFLSNIVMLQPPEELLDITFQPLDTQIRSVIISVRGAYRHSDIDLPGIVVSEKNILTSSLRLVESVNIGTSEYICTAETRGALILS